MASQEWAFFSGGRLLWLSPADFERLLAPLEEALPWRDLNRSAAGDGASSPPRGQAESANSLTWRAEEFEKLGQLGAGAFGQVRSIY